MAGNLNSVKDACLLLGSVLTAELFESLRSASPSDDSNDAFYLTFMRVLRVRVRLGIGLGFGLGLGLGLRLGLG